MSRAARSTPARMAMLAGALLLGLLPAACGRKGELEPPPGAESRYPRQYPSPSPQAPPPEQTPPPDES